jgi:hypothetical protein
VRRKSREWNFYQIIDILINMRLEERKKEFIFSIEKRSTKCSNTKHLYAHGYLKLCPRLALLQNNVAV